MNSGKMFPIRYHTEPKRLHMLRIMEGLRNASDVLRRAQDNVSRTARPKLSFHAELIKRDCNHSLARLSGQAPQTPTDAGCSSSYLP